MWLLVNCSVCSSLLNNTANVRQRQAGGLADESLHNPSCWSWGPAEGVFEHRSPGIFLFTGGGGKKKTTTTKHAHHQYTQQELSMCGSRHLHSHAVKAFIGQQKRSSSSPKTSSFLVKRSDDAVRHSSAHKHTSGYWWYSRDHAQLCKKRAILQTQRYGPAFKMSSSGLGDVQSQTPCLRMQQNEWNIKTWHKSHRF